MTYLMLNGAFVSGLLGWVNALRGNSIDSLEFWLILLCGILLNAIIGKTRHL